MADVQTTRDLLPVKSGSRRILASGALAGIIGGVIMAMFVMIVAAVKGMGFLMPLKLIGATLFGKDAMADGVGVLLVGLMIHMIASIGWGILFTAVFQRALSVANGIPIGAIFGIIVWAIMTFVVLPLVNPIMRQSVSMMPGAWFIEHLLFGMGAGLAPLLNRRLPAPAPVEQT